MSDAAPSAASARPDVRALGRTLVDTFGRAWSKGDVPLMMSVFSDDAVFLDAPFSQERRGLEAIRLYWRDVPVHQSEVVFTSGEIFSAGPWFSAEYKVVFRRRRTGEAVEARGAMFCETAEGKITELRMYWHRWVGGREG